MRCLAPPRRPKSSEISRRQEHERALISACEPRAACVRLQQQLACGSIRRKCVPTRTAGLSLTGALSEDLEVQYPPLEAHAWRRALRACSFCLPLVLASFAAADAPKPATSALALSDADGNVRAHAGVRLSMSGMPGTPDGTAAFQPIVRSRMGALRMCFTSALAQDGRAGGEVQLALQAGTAGKLVAKVVRGPARDAFLAQCAASALTGEVAPGTSRGSRVQVSVLFDNPVVRLGVVDPRMRSAEVRTAHGGMVETTSATQANEVKLSLKAPRKADAALGKIGARANAQIAGLLDCRRKSSRRARPAHGTIEVSGQIQDGKVRNVQVHSNGVGDRKASACVSAWLTRLDVHDLERAPLLAAVTFSK
jgi:hypothetical protein